MFSIQDVSFKFIQEVLHKMETIISYIVIGYLAGILIGFTMGEIYKMWERGMLERKKKEEK